MVLNLDASVVLLTPLYARVALQNGRDSEPFIVQPLLLALLASSVLPVSNLTNLIAAGAFHLTPGAFLVHLGPVSALAITLGFFLWRRTFRGQLGAVATSKEEGSGREPLAATRPRSDALVVGGVVAIVAGLGFVLGPYLGVEPWETAAFLDLCLALYLRRSPLSMVPGIPAVTVGTAALSALEFGSRLGSLERFSGSSLEVALTVVVSGTLATVANNIPAISILVVLLKGEPSVLRWAALLGVNMGPSLLVTGSLASILWLSLASEVGVKVGALQFARIAVRVTVPCFIVGLFFLTFSTLLPLW
jgi:arsenical pump membrane protein